MAKNDVISRHAKISKRIDKGYYDSEWVNDPPKIVHRSTKGYRVDSYRLANAYAKDSNPQAFMETSTVAFVDDDIERIQRWNAASGLQLPSSAISGLINSKSQSAASVNPSNEKSVVSPTTVEESDALADTNPEKAKEVFDQTNKEATDTPNGFSLIQVNDPPKIVHRSTWDKSDVYYSYQDEKHNHGWLDENGWLHRKAIVANTKNGKLYQVIFDIAKTSDGRLIYYSDKGKIKTVGQANIDSLLSQRSKANSQLNNYSKPQNRNPVKPGYSIGAGNSDLTRNAHGEFEYEGRKLSDVQR